jgi:hypothetical protein
MVGLVLAIAGGLAGCNKAAGPGKGDGSSAPAEAVGKFLTAICSADEKSMFALLTDEARSALKAHNMSPQLPSSGTTSFQIGEVEMVEGGAHVMTKWFDRMEDGSQDMTEVLWMLRQEKSGWRVAGMAMRVYDDQPAAILNFEDPDDMTRVLDLIAQEDERRSQGDAAEAARTSPAGATR